MYVTFVERKLTKKRLYGYQLIWGNLERHNDKKNPSFQTTVPIVMKFDIYVYVAELNGFVERAEQKSTLKFGYWR
ncbi:hypothetical protein TNCV_4253861 [Trichonephila clavipes]|nr:hypothetical protein TNCV_4253861 [Trichonephila clavipes]